MSKPRVPLLYTVEEAAELLTISRWKVFELIRLRELRSVKIGGLRRVPGAAIEEYIARLLGEAS
ncbi:helix-turn-helix domain-containing protein [Pseudonocardia hispaniensis]|uniref:Helix-turn-helix domain-containing protein n=1 Tax=Pseudonocardia hispaniensis TaxID=904933 RepID=A0ABW1J878_9PSEU